VGDTGFEPAPEPLGKVDSAAARSHFVAHDAAKLVDHVPIAPDLQAVVKRWPALPSAVKTRILAMVRNACES